MTETHVRATGQPLAAPLATNARTARYLLGPCPCRRPILPGERVCDLPDGRPVHVTCVARLEPVK